MDTSKSFAGHYDEFYRGDARFSAWRAAGAREKAANIIELWSRVSGGHQPRVVDIGCGDGAVAASLSSVGFFEELTGFDVSTSGIAAARARGIPRAEFHVSVGPLPSGEKAYDLAILSHVVEHVDEPRTLLREAGRVARHVLVEVPLEHHFRNRGDFQWTDVGHVNFYNPTIIRRLIQSSGLIVLDQLLTTPGRAWASERADRRALLKWRVKESLLKVSPHVATNLMTFHGTILARSY